MRILQVGHAEPLKAGVHAALAGLATVCGIYSVAAWLDRPDQPRRHLGFNAVVYFGLLAWEVSHVRSHTRRQLDPGARQARD